MNAYAAPLGMIAQGADTFAGQIPTILKCNNSNSLATNKDQAVTAGVKDALRLGCAAIGFHHLPGQRQFAFAQMEELRELTAEAKDAGLAAVVWSYPRGPNLDRAAETADRYRCASCRADGGADGRQYHQGEAVPKRRGQPGSRQEEL